MRLGLVAALGLGGCGGGTEERRTAPTASGAGASDASVADRPPPARGTPAQRAGRIPDRPQVLLDLRRRPSAWPARLATPAGSGGFVPGGYRLQARADRLLLAPAPRPAVPSTRSVLLESVVRLPDRGGAAGLFCRGSADRRRAYALLVRADGRWSVERLEDGRRRVLGSGVVSLRTTRPGQATALRLLCGAGRAAENLTLGFTINAQPLRFVRDARSLAPPGRGGLGLAARGGSAAPAQATFRGLAISHAVARPARS